MGAEIAVHGYDHLDFRGLSPLQAQWQFAAAADAFRSAGLAVDGFRCPYLGYSQEVLQAVPNGVFQYSSNQAIAWDVVAPSLPLAANSIYAQLLKFYRPKASSRQVSVPFLTGSLVEIPASIPDDLLLFDGLALDGQAVGDIWTAILRQSHERGELFVLLFHPEMFDQVNIALQALMEEAHQLSPAVWVTQLRHVAAWWREKAKFKVHIARQDLSRTHLLLDCSPRATVLVRGVSTSSPTRSWHSGWTICSDRYLAAEGRLPMIGLPRNVPAWASTFLAEQGYITEFTDDLTKYSLYLDANAIEKLESEVGIVRHIESSNAPLIRFSRWPHGYRNALCITGDLDVLSLVDYCTRFLVLQFGAV
jgi:peptidoglycan/xylan/chitin deacetylase (PgdA/CDA1 family)